MDWTSSPRLEWPSGRKICGAAAIGLSDECRREQVAKRILLARKLRESDFSFEILGEPAFDMLLKLYVLEALGRPVSLDVLQRTADVPLDVALRWLKVLHSEDLTTREPRKAGNLWVNTLIELTPLGREKLERYLDSIQGLVTYPPT